MLPATVAEITRALPAAFDANVAVPVVVFPPAVAVYVYVPLAHAYSEPVALPVESVYLVADVDVNATVVPATVHETGTPARAFPSESVTVAVIVIAPASAPVVDEPIEIPLTVFVRAFTEAVVFPPVTVIALTAASRYVIVTAPAVALPDENVTVSIRFVVDVDASAVVNVYEPVEPVFADVSAGLLRPDVRTEIGAFRIVDPN
jgi:hypothetical protein